MVRVVNRQTLRQTVILLPVATILAALLADHLEDRKRVYPFRGNEQQWGFRLKKDARAHAIKHGVDPRRVIKVDRMYWSGYAVGEPISGVRIRVLTNDGEWTSIEQYIHFSRIHGALRAAVEGVDLGTYLHSTVGLKHNLQEARARGWLDDENRPTDKGQALYHFYELDRMKRTPIDISIWQLTRD